MLGLPSTALFKDFCADLAAKLPHQWLRGKATQVHKDERTGKFQVQYSAHDNEMRVVTADAVVFATGPCGLANIPEPFRPLAGSGRVSHTNDFFKEGSIRGVIGRPPRILVVGGGLTAVQAALAAVAGGSRVVLRSRRPLQTRAYDIAADWLDLRHANRLRFEFLSTRPEERARFVKQAVQGGSVPESYMKELCRLADTTDLLEVQTDAALDRSDVCILDGGSVRVNREEFDHVILATGVSNAPMQLLLYKHVQIEFSAPLLNGLPHVDETLRWVKGEDLFVLGANAVLELGPGALNLMGAMRGAKIISSELRDLMWKMKGHQPPTEIIASNMFSLLMNEDESKDLVDSDDDIDDGDDKGSKDQQDRSGTPRAQTSRAA